MNRFFESEDGLSFPIEQVKVNLLNLVNADLKASLTKTDWQVVRAADPTSGKELSEAVISERQAARDLAVLLETQINNANTLENLQTFYTNNL